MVTDRSRPAKLPGGLAKRPFVLAEIARHEKWGDYAAANTANHETPPKVSITLLLAKHLCTCFAVLNAWYPMVARYPPLPDRGSCQHV